MKNAKPVNSWDDNYYDALASRYNELYGEEQQAKARLLLEYLSVKGLLLDIGGGTGIATDLFREKATCIVLDPSLVMLEHGKGFCVCGSAEYLPFADRTFDTIISLTALHHCDLRKALAEIERVRKPKSAVGITMLKQAHVDFSLFKDYKKIDGGKDWIFISD